MTTICQLLDEKGSEVWAIDPDDSVFNAVTEMTRKDVGGLLVMEGERIVGIITERDYARNVILMGKTSPETPVCEIMSTDVVCVTSEQTVSECMELMSEKRIRHLPVVDKDQVIGVISIGDLVKQVISEQKATIEELQKTGRGS
jgi:CBS domain-containing protein